MNPTMNYNIHRSMKSEDPECINVTQEADYE